MKKILVVDTTYRAKGNSTSIANQLAAEIPDAETIVVRLKEKNVNPCLGCDGCKGKESVGCVQQDDMAALVELLEQCDGLAVTAPIYFDALCGQAKIFFDRLYCYVGSSAASKKCKKAALICTCAGGPADVYTEYAKKVVGTLGIVGAEETKAYVCGGIFPAGAVEEHEEHRREVRAIAEWLGV